jgi:hypothetical protein
MTPSKSTPGTPNASHSKLSRGCHGTRRQFWSVFGDLVVVLAWLRLAEGRWHGYFYGILCACVVPWLYHRWICYSWRRRRDGDTGVAGALWT